MEILHEQHAAQEAQIICGRERCDAPFGSGRVAERLESISVTPLGTIEYRILVTPKGNLEDRHELPATEINARQVPGCATWLTAIESS